MILTTASSRPALPALRGWPLFIALSLLFHLLLFLLFYLLAPERAAQTDADIAPFAIQLEPAPQTAKVAPAAPPAPKPSVTKQAKEPVIPKPAAKPAAEEAAPVQVAPPPPIPERFRHEGTSQRLLDSFGPPIAPPPEAPKQDDNDKHLEIESLIRTRFAEHFVYPRMAQNHGWQGEVLLSFHINTDGSVSHIHIVHGSGYAILDQAALDSMGAIGHIDFVSGTVLHNVIELRMPVIYHLAQG